MQDILIFHHSYDWIKTSTGKLLSLFCMNEVHFMNTVEIESINFNVAHRERMMPIEAQGQMKRSEDESDYIVSKYYYQ